MKRNFWIHVGRRAVDYRCRPCAETAIAVRQMKSSRKQTIWHFTKGADTKGKGLHGDYRQTGTGAQTGIQQPPQK